MVQCVILCCRNVHNSIFIFDQPCINYKCMRSVKFAAARPFFLWLVPRWRAYLAIPFADWLPDGLAGHLAWLLRAGWLTGLAGWPALGQCFEACKIATKLLHFPYYNLLEIVKIDKIVKKNNLFKNPQ